MKSLIGETISDEQNKSQKILASLLDWNGIIKLLKLKDNLPVLFLEENEDKMINPVFIITSTYSFQNLKNIDLVFTKVTRKPFLDEIENREAELNHSLDPAEDLVSKYSKETVRINLENRNGFAESNWKSQLRDIEKQRLEKHGCFILKKEFPDWRDKMESLFNLRNEFVHSISSNEISREQTADFLIISDRFVKAVNNYLYEDFWCPSNEWTWEDL